MGRWDRNGAKSVFWKWACFLFIENSFIMPVTLLHQWEDRDNTMTKNPNAGENFEADWMNDLSFPVSFLISWVKTRHKLAHRLGARFVCVCSVERTAAFLFHIGCRMNICSCGCERWKCCRKISKWTVALILFTEWFPERKQGIAKLSHPASIGWVALSSLVRSFVVRPASVTSPFFSTIWCSRPYKPYIFC